MIFAEISIKTIVSNENAIHIKNSVFIIFLYIN
jgi:hypothetical protein